MTRSPALPLIAAILALSAAPANAQAGGWASLERSIAGDIERIAPPLVTREQWRARPAFPGMKPQTPAGIIIHHTAVRTNAKHSLEAKLRNLQSFSQRTSQEQRRGAWGDVPYHYYIDMHGRIGEGRDVRFAGDSNTRYDTTGHIQIVLEGDFEREKPSDAQLEALRKALTTLMLAWNIPLDRISVHKDHAATTCPGRNLLAVLPQELKAVAAERQRAVAALCGHQPGDAFARLYCGR